MRIKLLSENAKTPTKASDLAAGFDLYVPVDYTVKPGRNIIPLDFAIALPEGYEAQIRPRSGFSAKGFEGHAFVDEEYDIYSIYSDRFDADVLLGTIDADYRGNIGVIVKSNESSPFIVTAGTRIAQMVINKYCTDGLEIVEDLEDTERGSGGFGSTGTH